MVAGGQLLLAQTTRLSSWKGGGFGMFASLDARPFRHVRILANGNLLIPYTGALGKVSEYKPEIPLGPLEELLRCRRQA